MTGNNKRTSTENDREKEQSQVQIRYLDLARLIDGNDLKRFQQLAVKVDLNTLQNENKPFLFHAIEKNDAQLVKILLDEEIDINSKYHILVKANPAEKGTLHILTPLEYAENLERDDLAKLILSKMNEPSLDVRWLKKIETLDVEKIENFKQKIKDQAKLKDLLECGLIKSCELGSIRLIDYFIMTQKVNINCLRVVDKISVSPLLHAIAKNKIETAKYLIFRNSDIHQKGEYGDALVTALHFEASNDLITIILEKGANLASRHRDWPNLNLREYCVQMNKVKPKLAIDNFVLAQVARGEYQKLKALSENGYLNINVTNQFRKTSRDLAIERNHHNIVQLIDDIEESQRRLKTKMNY